MYPGLIECTVRGLITNPSVAWSASNVLSAARGAVVHTAIMAAGALKELVVDEAKVAPAIADYMVETLQMESVSKALYAEQKWLWAEAVIKATESSMAVSWACRPGTGAVPPVMPGTEEHPRGGGDRSRGKDRRGDHGRRDHRSRSRRRQGTKGKGKGRYHSPPKSQPPCKGSGSGSDLRDDINENRCKPKQRDCPRGRSTHAATGYLAVDLAWRGIIAVNSALKARIASSGRGVRAMGVADARRDLRLGSDECLRFRGPRGETTCLGTPVRSHPRPGAAQL